MMASHVARRPRVRSDAGVVIAHVQRTTAWRWTNKWLPGAEVLGVCARILWAHHAHAGALTPFSCIAQGPYIFIIHTVHGSELCMYPHMYVFSVQISDSDW